MSAEEHATEAFFKNASALTISEVALVLKSHTDKMKQGNPDFQPNPLLVKTIDYSNTFGTNKNRDTIDKIRG